MEEEERMVWLIYRERFVDTRVGAASKEQSHSPRSLCSGLWRAIKTREFIPTEAFSTTSQGSWH